MLKGSIIKLRLNGFSLKEIAKELNCSTSTVNFHLKKSNLDGNLYKILNKLECDNVKGYEISFLKEFMFLREQFNLKSIKVKLNITKIEASKINRLLGYFPKIKNYTFEEENEIISLYKEKKSIIGVARIKETTPETIKKTLLKNNVKLHNKQTKSQIVINWRKRKKQLLVDYKGGKCQNCGYKKSIGALEFHHINSEEKEFTISASSFSFERLKKEVDKCVLVCSNCHIEIHEQLRENGESEIMKRLLQ